LGAPGKNGGFGPCEKEKNIRGGKNIPANYEGETPHWGEKQRVGAPRDEKGNIIKGRHGRFIKGEGGATFWEKQGGF